MKIFAVVLVLFSICGELKAQDAVDTVTRSEQIENEQSAKAQTLIPDRPARAERRFTRIQHQVEEIFSRAPVHLQFGGLPMASGFAVGPVNQWANATDKIQGRVWAVGSLREFYSVGAGVKLPRITSEHLALSLDVSRQDAPQLDYYGPGPTSLKSNRTDYRREDSLAELNAIWPYCLSSRRTAASRRTSSTSDRERTAR